MKTGHVVLLTDFGAADPYAGILKGVLLSMAPHVRIVDLTHGIEPQNILQGAHILRASSRYFPDGSVFLCIVDPGVGTSRDIVCVKTNRHFFIGPDNGLLALAVENQPAEIRAVRNSNYFLSDSPSPTFHGRDIMAPAAARLALKGDKIFRSLGPVKSKLIPLWEDPVMKSEKKVQGKILYFDHYGSAITNIRSADAPEDFWSGAKVAVNEKAVGGLRKSYLKGPKSLCALWNSLGALEIALPCGSARQKAGLRPGDKVVVKP